MKFTTTQRGARSLIYLNRFVRKTAALAFVPRWFMRLAWQAVKHEAPPLPRVQELIAYYEETWLVGNYPLPLWNVFESGSVRTKQSRGRLAQSTAEEGCWELEDYLSGISAHIHTLVVFIIVPCCNYYCTHLLLFIHKFIE